MQKEILSMSRRLEIITQGVCNAVPLALPISSQTISEHNGAASSFKESFQIVMQSMNQVFCSSLARKIVVSIPDCKKWLSISVCFVVNVPIFD